MYWLQLYYNTIKPLPLLLKRTQPAPPSDLRNYQFCRGLVWSHEYAMSVKSHSCLYIRLSDVPPPPQT